MIPGILKVLFLLKFTIGADLSDKMTHSQPLNYTQIKLENLKKANEIIKDLKKKLPDDQKELQELLQDQDKKNQTIQTLKDLDLMKKGKKSAVFVDEDPYFKYMFERIINREGLKLIDIKQSFQKIKKFDTDMSIDKQIDRVAMANHILDEVFEFVDVKKQMKTYDKNIEDLDFLLQFQLNKHFQKIKDNSLLVLKDLDQLRNINKEVLEIYKKIKQKFEDYYLNKELYDFRESTVKSSVSKMDVYINHKRFGDPGNCSKQLQCKQCTKFTNCVWCPSKQTCIEGDMYGPMDDICDDYQFALCGMEGCYANASCKECASKLDCKWDLKYQVCINIETTRPGKYLIRRDIIKCKEQQKIREKD